MASKLNISIDTTTPVVFFNANNYTSLGVVRSLGRMGIKVFCIDPDPDALAMKSRYCAGRFKWDFDSSPPNDTVQFLIDVARMIGQTAILLSIPEPGTLLIDQYRDQLSKWFLLPQPIPGAVTKLYNKQSMFELCKSEGVPTAETFFPGSVEQALNEGPGLGYPLVVKAIDSDRLMRYTGRRLTIVQDQSELRGAYSELDEPGFSNLALQEFIPGDIENTWVVGAYFDTRGDCRFTITGRKLRQLPIHGGVTTLGVCAPCESVVNSICRIGKAAGYQGILDADFIYDKRDGFFKLLDVNPRPGANFRLLVDKHGLDVVRSLYLDLTGQSLPVVEPCWGRRWVVEDKDLEALRAHSLEGSLKLRDWFGSLRGVSELAYTVTDDLRPSTLFLFKLTSTYAHRLVRRLLRLNKHSS